MLLFVVDYMPTSYIFYPFRTMVISLQPHFPYQTFQDISLSSMASHNLHAKITIINTRNTSVY